MLIARGATKFLGLLFVLAGGRLLGAEEFGVLALSLSVVTIAQNIAVFGLPTTIQRIMSGGGGADVESTYTAILVAGLAGSFLGAFGLHFLAHWLATGVFDTVATETPLRILSLWLIFMVGVALARAVLQAQEEVGGIILLDVTERGGKVALLAVSVVVIGSGTSELGAWAVAVSGGLALLLGVKLVARLELRPTIEMGGQHLKRVLRYSLPFAVVGFSYLLARHADRLMLGMLAKSADVGVYTVSSSIAMALIMVHGSLVSIFKPVASSAFRNNQLEKLSAAYHSVGKWSATMAALLLLLIVAGGNTALGLVGTQYGSSAAFWTLTILGALYFVGTLVGPTGAVLQMAEGHRLEMGNTVVFVLLNIGLNYILIPKFGMLGAAGATFSSGVVRNILQVAELRFLWNFTVLNIRQILFGCVVTLGASIGLTLVDPLWRGIVCGFSIVAVIGFTMWRMTAQEWELVNLLGVKLRKLAHLN